MDDEHAKRHKRNQDVVSATVVILAAATGAQKTEKYVVHTALIFPGGTFS